MKLRIKASIKKKASINTLKQYEKWIKKLIPFEEKLEGKEGDKEYLQILGADLFKTWVNACKVERAVCNFLEERLGGYSDFFCAYGRFAEAWGIEDLDSDNFDDEEKYEEFLDELDFVAAEALNGPAVN
jgi:hypothetical protein